MILSIFSKRNETVNTNSHRPESKLVSTHCSKSSLQDQDSLKINPPRYGLAGSLA